VDRRRLLAGAGAAACGALFAPVRALAQSPGPAPIDEAAVDVLPNLVTRMAVPVRLNGEGPYHFVVDTGANRTALAEDVAAALALPPGPEVLVHGVTAAEATRTVRLGRLTVADRTYRDITAPVLPRSRLGVDGLLGVDVLGHFRLTFDMTAGQVWLARPRVSVTLGSSGTTSRRLRDATRLRARQRYGQLTAVDVHADDVEIHALVDSGAQFTVGNMALFRSVAVRRPDVLQRRWTVPVIGATGGVITGELAVLRELRLGGSTVYDLPVIFADLHAFSLWRLEDTPALLLGADVLGLFSHVTLDYGRREMSFGRVIERAPPPPPGAPGGR